MDESGQPTRIFDTGGSAMILRLLVFIILLLVVASLLGIDIQAVLGGII